MSPFVEIVSVHCGREGCVQGRPEQCCEIIADEIRKTGTEGKSAPETKTDASNTRRNFEQEEEKENGQGTNYEEEGPNEAGCH